MELCKFFCFCAAGSARKLMKPKHIFASPGKTELKKSTQFSLSFWACKVCIKSKVEHSSLPYLQRNFILKCCYDLCAIWQYPTRHTWYLSAQSFITQVFKEGRTWWLWMSGKWNVSVCRGHELANALYKSHYLAAELLVTVTVFKIKLLYGC